MHHPREQARSRSASVPAISEFRGLSVSRLHTLFDFNELIGWHPDSPRAGSSLAGKLDKRGLIPSSYWPANENCFVLDRPSRNDNALSPANRFHRNNCLAGVQTFANNFYLQTHHIIFSRSRYLARANPEPLIVRFATVIPATKFALIREQIKNDLGITSIYRARAADVQRNSSVDVATPLSMPAPRRCWLAAIPGWV